METTRVDAREPMSLDDFPRAGNLEDARWVRELAPVRIARVRVDDASARTRAGGSAAAPCPGASSAVSTPVPGAATRSDVSATISLWLCDLQQAAHAVDVLAPLLSSTEHERAARFGTQTLRERWMVGRATLRLLLGRRTHTAPGSVRLQRGRRGRPQLKDAGDIDFNVSHTGGISVIAIADKVRIGVDIERKDRRLAADKLARKFLSADEAARMQGMSEDERRKRFLQHWTCKEAMSKATGDGLIAPFARIETDIQGNKLTVVAGPEPYAPRDWALIDVPAADELFVTLAVWYAHRDM
jgi:4'-phosphopantetheinyl transferase